MRAIVTLFAFMVYESSCPVPLLFIWRTLSQPFQEETFPSPPLSAFGEIFTQHWKVSIAKNIREKTSRTKCNQELGVVKNILWSRLITYEYVKNMFSSTIPAEHDFRLIDFAKISNLIGNLFRVRNFQTWNSLKQIDRQISLLLYLCHENSLEKISLKSFGKFRPCAIQRFPTIFMVFPSKMTLNTERKIKIKISVG